MGVCTSCALQQPPTSCRVYTWECAHPALCSSSPRAVCLHVGVCIYQCYVLRSFYCLLPLLCPQGDSQTVLHTKLPQRLLDSQVAQWVKNSPANAGTWVQSNPSVRMIPWRRKRQPTPVFLLGNSLDRGAWWATVHGVAKKPHTTR